MRRIGLLGCHLLAFSWGVAVWPQAPASAPLHLQKAVTLLKHVHLDDTAYVHGLPSVKWKGSDGAQKYSCHADCSGFLDAILEHSYGYDREAFKKWFGKGRPTADLYHDKMVEEVGFMHLPDFRHIKPGDLLAVKYFPRKKNTGHVMLVAGLPKKMAAGKPLVEGTEQWEVAIIDCSMSGHGMNDTRHKKGEDGKDHTGLGQGVLRVYTHPEGTIAGWTWSTQAGSKFRDMQEEHLVAGRLKPCFTP